MRTRPGQKLRSLLMAPSVMAPTLALTRRRGLRALLRRRSLGSVGAAVGTLIASAFWWLRNRPAAGPAAPFQTSRPAPPAQKLLALLEPRRGERILVIGAMPPDYSTGIAEALGSDGLDLLDSGFDGVTALPYADGTFDGAVVWAALGEMRDQYAGLRDVARVLRPSGRMVLAELFGHAYWVGSASVVPKAAGAGLEPVRHAAGTVGYFTLFQKAR